MDQQNFEETWFTCWHFSRLKFKIIWSVTHLVSLKLMIVSVSDLILSTEKCIICLTNIFTDKQFRILTPQIVFLLPHWQVKQWRAHCCQSSQYNSNKDLYKILKTSVSNARLSVWKMALLSSLHTNIGFNSFICIRNIFSKLKYFCQPASVLRASNCPWQSVTQHHVYLAIGHGNNIAIFAEF